MAIEKAEFIDDESWRFLKVIVETDICFLVLSITASELNTLKPEALEIIRHRNTRTIELPAIDKWFHSGLACQVLQVNAIPPELEK